MIMQHHYIMHFYDYITLDIYECYYNIIVNAATGLIYMGQYCTGVILNRIIPLVHFYIIKIAHFLYKQI